MQVCQPGISENCSSTTGGGVRRWQDGRGGARKGGVFARPTCKNMGFPLSACESGRGQCCQVGRWSLCSAATQRCRLLGTARGLSGECQLTRTRAHPQTHTCAHGHAAHAKCVAALYWAAGIEFRNYCHLVERPNTRGATCIQLGLSALRALVQPRRSSASQSPRLLAGWPRRRLVRQPAADSAVDSGGHRDGSHASTTYHRSASLGRQQWECSLTNPG